VFKLELSYSGLLLIAAGVVTIWAMAQLWPVLLLVVVAFIFMAALLPYVEWLVRNRLPRPAAVLLVLVTLLAVVGGLMALVVPAMVDEFSSIRDTLPRDAEKLEDLLADIGVEVELSDRADNIDWGGLISGRAALDYGQRVVFGLLSFITILVVTAYLLIEAPRMKAYLFRFIPDPREPDAERILEALGRVVGGYIRGQVITSAVIGLFTLIVLLVVDVPNPLAFAVLAAFADVIPLVGAIIAIVPPTFAAFEESTAQAIAVLTALLLYQQFEDRFLVPRVYGATLGLPPLVVLVSVLVGAELLGIPGVLLALPAAAVIKVGLDFVMERRDPTNAFAPLQEDEEVAAPDDPPEPVPGSTSGDRPE
jgi:predicted PurR-regulated permease PerM